VVYGHQPLEININYLGKIMLTKQQILDNINALEQQGANQDEIQQWLDSMKGKISDSQSVEQTQQTQPEEKKSFGRKVFDFFTGSEQKFGKDIAQTGYLMFGGQKKIETISKQYMDNGDKLLQLANKTTDKERKSQLIKLAQDMYKDAGMVGEDIIGHVSSAKQVLGNAGGVLLDVLSAGTYGKAAKAMQTGNLSIKALPTVLSKTIQKVGIKQGAKQGVKIGGLWGAAYGFTGGLQEDKSALGIAGSTAMGAGTGALVGGIIGGITGGIQSKMLKVKEQRRALESIVPLPNELTPEEYDFYLKNNLVTPKTRGGTAKIIPTDDQIELAAQFQDLLQSKDPVVNSRNVIDEIVQADSRVENYLSKRNVGYSKDELTKFITDKVKPITDIYVPNQANVDKLKNEVINNFVSKIKDTQLKSVWADRKIWDRIIDERLKAFSGSPNLKKELARGVRNAAQEFIASKLPENIYQQEMKFMTKLYRVFDFISDKAVKERNYSGITLMIKKHPLASKIIGGLLVGGGISAVGAGLYRATQ